VIKESIDENARGLGQGNINAIVMLSQSQRDLSRRQVSQNKATLGRWRSKLARHYVMD
jgi:hypothetical protein